VDIKYYKYKNFSILINDSYFIHPIRYIFPIYLGGVIYLDVILGYENK